MADQFIGIDARRIVAEEAAKGIGLGHKDVPPGRQAACGALLYPHDRVEWRPAATRDQLSCMIHACRSLERALLPRDPDLYKKVPLLGEPYEKHAGQIPFIFQQIGHKYDAWWDCSTVQGTRAYLEWNGGAGMGDMPWMGMDRPDGTADPAYGGHSHVSCITDQKSGFLPDDVEIEVVIAADGGQNNNPGYQILERARQYVVRRGFLWAVDLKVDPNDSALYSLAGTSRRVWGVIDPSRGLLREVLERGV